MEGDPSNHVFIAMLANVRSSWMKSFKRHSIDWCKPRQSNGSLRKKHDSKNAWIWWSKSSQVLRCMNRSSKTTSQPTRIINRRSWEACWSLPSYSKKIRCCCCYCAWSQHGFDCRRGSANSHWMYPGKLLCFFLWLGLPINDGDISICVINVLVPPPSFHSIRFKCLWSMIVSETIPVVLDLPLTWWRVTKSLRLFSSMPVVAPSYVIRSKSQSKSATRKMRTWRVSKERHLINDNM